MKLTQILLKKVRPLYESGFSVPVILQRFSPVRPWEFYQRICPNGLYSFFLDSLRYAPPAQRYSYLGWRPYLHVFFKNQILRIEGEMNRIQKNPNLTRELRKLFRGVRLPPGPTYDFFTGGAVGYWGYELAEEFESVSFRKKKPLPFAKLELLFFRDLVVFDHKKDCYYLVSWLVPKRGVSFRQAFRQAEENLEEMEGLLSSPNGRPTNGRFSFLGFKPEISKPLFKRMVERAKSYIEAGDIYQANLSQRFSFHFKGSPLELYGRLRETNPSPYAALLHLNDLWIASSSPELLIAKKGCVCVTSPIAGTRPRGRRRGETRCLERELFTNEKERAEHLMLVDLERNDLGRVSKWRSVRVKDFMRIEKYARVMHLVSDVTGELRPSRDAWDLIQAMFPGGTITGCPKIRSMEIIDELEPVERGVYTGSIGYVGFDGDLMLNIAIRTLVLHRNRGFLQVGAGIVADSDPDCEYDETLAKGEALAEALIEASV